MAEQPAHDAAAAYQHWLRRHALTPEAEARWRTRLATLATAPRMQLLLVSDGRDTHALHATLDSLARQLYSNIQVTVLAPEAVALPQSVVACTWREPAERELRAREALDQGEAEWCAVLQAGDSLAPQALAALAIASETRPAWQYLYIDEDRLGPDGTRHSPQFKPDFNLDLLRSSPYVGEVCFLRRAVLAALPDLHLTGPAASIDALWQAHDHFGEPAIGHVAEMLLHRPERPLTAEHSAAVEAALTAHLVRRRVNARPEPGQLPGTFRIHYHHAATPLVSILIPTRDRLELLQPCVESILQKTGYSNYEIIILDNDSRDPATLAWLDEKARQPGGRVRVERHPGPFNYAAMNNRAAQAARGEFLLLFNNDTRIVQEFWLERMVMHGLRPEVGAVGARLVYPDGRLQHAGVVLGMGRMGIADHVHIGLPFQEPGDLGRAQLDQNFSAVTAACLLVKRELFVELGGFDAEQLKVLFNDVDLCLRLAERGLKIVWTPGATVVHYGSMSQRASPPDAAKLERIQAEKETMLQRWCARHASDPAYNPHLSLVEPQPVPECDIDPDWSMAAPGAARIMGYPLDHHGCGEYRILAPLRALQRAGRAETFILPEHARQRLPSPWELARAGTTSLLLQSPAHDFQIHALRDYRALNSVFKVLELDDLKTAVPTASLHSKTLYPDMEDRLRTAASFCDRMIVTTEPLKEACRGWHDDIVVVPNALERERWEGLTVAKHNGPRPRVGWAGGLSHSGDLALLTDVFAALAKDVDFVIFGLCPEALKPYVREHHAAVRFPDYPAKLASLALDVALAPLAVNAFNECKSNLKLLEYGMLGWPVIATDIAPYRATPVTRVANDPGKWIAAIREHLDQPVTAAEHGARLRQWVLDYGMLDAQLPAWQRALSPEHLPNDTRSPA